MTDTQPVAAPAAKLRTHDELKAIAESGAAELGWDAPPAT
ncbi:phosphoadenosine phosphosulfate reductase [Arthrobacter sp. Hiyo4]|nr:phosphoadenosine phosphosulfate reductase [Arthrobacter sp. Hiyo4]